MIEGIDSPQDILQDKKRQAQNECYQRWAAEDRADSVNDLRELLQLESFRRFLASIIKRGRVFGSISSMDVNDTNQVFRSIGWRELAVDIYGQANRADGEMVMQAIRERNELERDRMDEMNLLLQNYENN